MPKDEKVDTTSTRQTQEQTLTEGMAFQEPQPQEPERVSRRKRMTVEELAADRGTETWALAAARVQNRWVEGQTLNESDYDDAILAVKGTVL